MNPMASKMLSKPASLGKLYFKIWFLLTNYVNIEQPSSSSISTTTSSVTSMTSLEHEEGSRGNESVSDYDYDHWGDNDNWGDMEVHLIDLYCVSVKIMHCCVRPAVRWPAAVEVGVEAALAMLRVLLQVPAQIKSRTGGTTKNGVV
jgi:hypothetical protein